MGQKVEEKHEKISEKTHIKLQKEEEEEAEIEATALTTCPPSLIEEKEKKVTNVRKALDDATKWEQKAASAVENAEELVKESPTTENIAKIKKAQQQRRKAKSRQESLTKKLSKYKKKAMEVKDVCVKIKET